MRRLPAAIAALLTALATLAAAAPAGAVEAVPSPYVITLEESARTTDADVDSLEGAAGFRATHRYGHALRGFSAHLTPAQLERVRRDPIVAAVVPDVTFRASGLASLSRGETLPVGVRRIAAASLTQVHAAANTGVAVLDTGLDLANADFQVAGGVNCVKPGTPAADDHGHGTHVAGTLAGRNSGTGVVGVAPGTRLYSVKVLGAKGTGVLSQILCGIDWVTRNAAELDIDVANMSLEASGASDGNCGRSSGDLEHQAICASVAAGVTYVASAGNSAADFAKVVPAAYPEVLTATAMTDVDGIAGAKAAVTCDKQQRDDEYWRSSNFATSAASAGHSIAAPGACVVSSKRGGGTATSSGTSMAAPHVAGAVALCMGNGGLPGPCAGLAPAQVIAKLRADAALAAPTAGFLGDSRRPVAGRLYGDLVAAAGY